MSPEEGALVLVVGPSGAGKDTLLRLAAREFSGDPRVVFARRVVTRQADASEDHDTLDAEAFAAARARGAFALHWNAHGLDYGIPAACLAPGRVAVCNVSRAIVLQARAAFPRLRMVYVTAPQAILAARLALRNRAEKIDQRLARAAGGDAIAAADLVIDNSGPPEAGAATLAMFLKQQIAAHPAKGV